MDGLLLVLIILPLFTEYFDAAFGLGLIDDVCIIALLLLQIVFALLSARRSTRKWNVSSILVYFSFMAAAIIFLFTETVPFLYELYKLSLFCLFWWYFSFNYENERFTGKLTRTLTIILAVNLVLVALQYLVSPDILSVFGIPPGYFRSTMRRDRWAGLLTGSTVMGTVCVYTYLLGHVYRNAYSKKLKLVSAISVLVSTSKGAMLILVVVWLWLNVVNARRNRLRYIALTAVMVTAFYSINHRAIETKVDQYVELAKYVWTGMDEGSVPRLERRALSILEGIRIIKDEYPRPLGLGSWGDASSRYNTQATIVNTMSDSYLIHLLVEQGVLFLLYAFAMGISIIRADAASKKYMTALFLAIGGMFFFTMGFSSGGWPILAVFIYGKLAWGGALGEKSAA